MAEVLTAWQILQWVTTIIIGIGVIISSAYMIKNFNNSRKITSGNLVVTIENIITKENNVQVYREISTAYIHKTPLKNVTSQNLLDYLSDLEIPALFVNQGIIDKYFAYEMFGENLIEAWEVEDCKKAIQEQRDIYLPDYLSQVETAVKIMKDIKTKRVKSKTNL